MTVLTVSLLRVPLHLVLSPDLEVPALEAEVEELGWHVTRDPDPGAVVDRGGATAGTDGTTLWLYRGGANGLRIEGVVRRHFGASWRPDNASGRAEAMRSKEGARHLVQFIGALFAFYGVVFGAGSVARDRDEGTLEAELSLPVPMWVHGVSRWLAASTALVAFYTLSVLVFHALLGLDDPMGLTLHGSAAAITATAIGIAVIGRAGMHGFAGPMSAGLVIVGTLLGFGLTSPRLAVVFPIASLVARDHTAGPALVLSAIAGMLAVAVFRLRATVI